MAFPLALLALLAGTAVQSFGQNQALKKQQGIALRNQQEQINERNRATDVALRKSAEFAPETRQESQQQIAQQLEGDYNQAAQSPAITAQGVQVGGTIPMASGSNDYLAASAREKAKSTESLRTLAQLMGRIGSAGQLRRDEAVGIGDTAGQIGRIQDGANNMNQIGSMEADAVRPSIGSQLIGGALSAYGAGSLATSGVGGATKAATSYANPGVLAMTRGPWN